MHHAPFSVLLVVSSGKYLQKPDQKGIFDKRMKILFHSFKHIKPFAASESSSFYVISYISLSLTQGMTELSNRRSEWEKVSVLEHRSEFNRKNLNIPNKNPFKIAHRHKDYIRI